MTPGCVITFSGHMIAPTYRPVARFPPDAESAVRARIRQMINQNTPYATVSSAACGGDIIFAEELLRRGIPLYVILPFSDSADLIQHSVAYASANWVTRWKRVCEQANQVPHYMQPGGYRNDWDFEYNQWALLFFALGVAAPRHIPLVCLILCDAMQTGREIWWDR